MNKKNYLRKEHYSIRKLTVGVCSVLIGTSLFWLGGQTNIVHAGSIAPTSTQESQVVKTDNLSSQKSELLQNNNQNTIPIKQPESSLQQSQPINESDKQLSDKVPELKSSQTDSKQSNETNKKNDLPKSKIMDKSGSSSNSILTDNNKQNTENITFTDKDESNKDSTSKVEVKSSTSILKNKDPEPNIIKTEIGSKDISTNEKELAEDKKANDKTFEIWVNKGTKELTTEDALRGLPKQQDQNGYAKLTWNTNFDVSNLNLDKAGDYHAVVEITYKNGLGTSTNVKVHVVDLKGQTFTRTIGSDLSDLWKNLEEDLTPGTYPAGSKFLATSFPNSSIVTPKNQPSVGNIQVVYPDGNFGIVPYYVNIIDKLSQKDINVPITRTVHFGYWDGSRDNLTNWRPMEPDVKQTINLKYKVKVNSKGNIVKYIGWEPNQSATLAGVNWININGWHPNNNYVDPQSNKSYAGIPVTTINLFNNKYVVAYNYNCYAAYDKNTYFTRTIASKEVIRRIHFVDVNDKTGGYVYPSTYQYLTFDHNVKVDQYGHQVVDLGWQAYDGKALATFSAVPWKDLTQYNWYKYNVDVRNAADAYTVLASDVAQNPDETQFIDVYAQYVSPHIERLTDQRIVHYGHYKNQGPHDGSQGTFDKNHRPIDWEDLTDPVMQNIEVDVYEYTTSDHITHFIKYMSANPTHFDPVEWKYIKGWYHVSEDTYAAPTEVIKSSQIDLNGKVEHTDIIYREYAKDAPEDKVIGSKFLLRRVYFGYYGDGTSIKEIPNDGIPTNSLSSMYPGHQTSTPKASESHNLIDPSHQSSTPTSYEWHNLTDPETQFLVFYHHQISYHDPRNGQTRNYWQAYDGNTLKTVNWKDIDGWTKAYDSEYAAGSRTFDDIEKEIVEVPQNKLIFNIYAPYIKNAQPTKPSQQSQPTKPTSPVKPTKPIQPTDPLPPSEPNVVPPTSTPKPTQPVPKSTPTPQPSQASQPTQPTTVKHVIHHKPPKPDTHTTPVPKPTPNPAPKSTPKPKPSYNYNNRPHSEIINSNPTNSNSNVMPHGETTLATNISNVAPHSENINKPGAIGSNVTPLGQLLPHGDKIGPKGTIVNAAGQVVGYIDKSGKAHVILPQTGENQHSTLAAAVLGAAAFTISLLGLANIKKREN